MKFGKTIGSIALAGSLLTGCGGGKGNTNPDTNTTTPDTNTTIPVEVDSALECTITQVGKITENNATVNTQCKDPDGIKSGSITVDGQNIELTIPENTTEFDFNTTIENLPSDENISVELEVSSVNSETEETDSKTFTGEVETKSPEIIDTEKPVITLNGPSTITLTVGDTYTEQGASANDNVDGNLTNDIIINSSNVDTSVAGTYNVTYTVFDLAGNETIVIRTVEVVEAPNQAPSISITSSSTNITVGESFTLTANASDSDGTVTSIVWYDGNENEIGTGTSVSVTPNTAGTYSYYSKVTDNDGAVTTSNTETITVNEVTSTYWMTIPSGNSVEDPSGNTPELVLSSVVDYINNYNGTDTISVEGDTRFAIQNGNLVYIGGNITGADQTVTLQLNVGGVLSNSFTVTIKNTY